MSGVREAGTQEGPTRSRTGLRRVAAVVAWLVLAGWIVGPNLPAGPALDALEGLWRPATEIGLEQDWGVFSPDPLDESVQVLARVDLSDGSTVTWTPPERSVLLGAYSEYRWQKWRERVRLDARADLWDPTAAWAAGEIRGDDREPVRVTLVRRWRAHLPLTAEGIDDGDWQEFAFHVWIPS